MVDCIFLQSIEFVGVLLDAMHDVNMCLTTFEFSSLLFLIQHLLGLYGCDPLIIVLPRSRESDYIKTNLVLKLY